MSRKRTDRKVLDAACQAHARGEGSLRDVAARFGLRKGTLNEAVKLLSDAPLLYARFASGELSLYEAHEIRKDPNFKCGEQRKRDRLQRISEMASAGHHSEDIAAAVGMNPDTVREKMRAAGIRLAERQFTRTFKAQRVVEETANGLAGYAIGASRVGVAEAAEIDPAEAGELAERITESLAALRALARRLASRATEQANQPEEVDDNVTQ